MNPDVVISLERIGKSFRRDSLVIEVLADIDLEVRSAEFVALMGPSGSGKSTLLNLVAGIDRPSSGVLRVAGEDLSRLSEAKLASWRQRHIGFVFQFYNLLPVLTALENVELPLTLTKLSRQERRKRAVKALEVVGLSDRLDHYPRQLSGGQEQRVAIARAIVTDPTVILADEPTGDLDAESARQILDLLLQLNEEFAKTILMVTHDPRAAAFAGRCLHLTKGQLETRGVPA